MADDEARAAERRWRQDPSDREALGRAVGALRRAGLAVPADLLDARLEPPSALETALPLEVWAVLPGARDPVTVGWGPGRVEVPACRWWGVGDVPAGREGLAWLGDELRRRAIPGLSLAALAPSRRRGPRDDDDDPRLDAAGLAALGPQPQLRWLELPRRGVQWVTPGEVVRALGCRGLEVLRGEFLVGDRGAEDDGAPPPLEGLEDLGRLRELELLDCELEPADLAPIGALPELDALALGEDRPLLDAVAGLPAAARLRRLAVRHDAEVEEAAPASAARLGALEDLALGGVGRAAALAAALAALPRLRAVSTSAATPAEVAALRGLPVTSLQLAAAASGEVVLADLAGREGLAALEVGAGSPAGLSRLAGARGLRRLTLLGAARPRGPWPPGLEALAAPGAPLDREAARALASLAALEDLDVTLGPGAGGAAALAGLARLRRLTLLVDPGGAAPLELPGLPGLRALSANPTPADLDAVAALPALETLLLGVARLAGADLAPLARLEGLRTLSVVGPRPDAVELLALLRRLPGLRRLVSARPAVADAVRAELPWVAVVEA